MKNILSITLLCLSLLSFGQDSPILYIHIVSHNEPDDNLQNFINYAKAKQNALQMAQIVDSKNVKWNLQTSDGFVLGALADQAKNNENIFNLLASFPYSDNIEIDPRSKNMDNRNIADQWYLLDSLGANPTTHLGGCIYSTNDSQNHPIDWEQYRNPTIGNIYGNSWQCTIITGAGSYPPHQNDLNDFGIFKPDSPTNFYQNNPNQNLWCMGTGCAPVLDSLDDEQAIIDLIQGQVDSIQNKLWPQDKFYVTRIMTNQREYGPLFFQKIAKVIDSLNLISDTKLKWATVGEVFTAFEQWEATTLQDHSQWLCGETLGIKENTLENVSVYPNPFNSQVQIECNDNKVHQIKLIDVYGEEIVNTTFQNSYTYKNIDLSSGVYFIQIDNLSTYKLIKD